jgi:hypothetical protein
VAGVAGPPIIPVGLRGTDAVQAPHERLPHLGSAVRIGFGSPLLVSPDDLARQRLRVMTDRMMRARSPPFVASGVGSYADHSTIGVP